ncbi:MAG: DNA-methyltransferase, partial [Bacteroidota bacterium]
MSHHITNHLIIQGDCIDGMKTVPSESVHCVVTSPPYYGLRDYGTATWEGGDPLCNHTISMDTKWNDPKRGTDVLRPEVAHRGGSSSHCHLCGATRIDQQIGLEESPDEYVARLVEVFREVRRILRHDGTVWLNLGDSYAGNNSQASNNGRAGYGNPRERVVNRISEGLKPKDLIGIPWRVAFALQADGWWLRQDIIWHKPNPMPESVSDRCTKSHEYIFLLTKSERYYYDKDAIAEPITDESALRYLRGVSDTHKNINGAPGQPPHSMNQARPNVRKAFTDDMGGGGTSFIGHSGYKKADGQIMIKENRNKRSVWTVATQPYP